MFSCELCEISKNTFSYRTPLVAASAFPLVPVPLPVPRQKVSDEKIKKNLLTDLLSRKQGKRFAKDAWSLRTNNSLFQRALKVIRNNHFELINYFAFKLSRYCFITHDIAFKYNKSIPSTIFWHVLYLLLVECKLIIWKTIRKAELWQSSWKKLFSKSSANWKTLLLTILTGKTVFYFIQSKNFLK